MHQRQNKIELTRILLQLPDGTLRRLCSFGNPKDKLDESYLKLIFPDLHRQPLQKILQNSQWEIQEIDVAPEGMSEFSYHYKGGIAHFKDALSSRIDQDWIVPDIQKSPCMHLLRFLVFNVQWSKPFPASKLSSHDFVMPRPFDGRARCIEFWLSNKNESELKVVANSEEEEVQMYDFQLDDPGHSMHITDGYWIKPHLIRPDSSFEIFRFSNPTTLVTIASSTTGDL